MSLPYLNNSDGTVRLSGRTEVLYWPRYRPSRHEQFRDGVKWVGLCFLIGLMVVVLDGFKGFLLPPFYVLVLDVARWGYLRNTGRLHWPKSPLLCAPATAIWGVAVFVPFIAYTHGVEYWAMILVIFAGWRVLDVGLCMRDHYLDYLLEDHGLPVSRRRIWKRALRAWWPWRVFSISPPQALTDAERKQFRKARNQLGRYGLAMALAMGWVPTVATAVGAIYVSPEPELLVELPFNPGFGFVPVLIFCIPFSAYLPRLLRAWDPEGDYFAVWRAIQVWCHSPSTVPEKALAPWAARSRYGRADDRTACLFWNTLLVACVILPVAVYYPFFQSDIYGLYISLDYQIAGSNNFARINSAMANGEIPRWQLLAVAMATFVATPILMLSTFAALIAPSIRAGEILFRGRNALEHERRKIAHRESNSETESRGSES